jgi:hypothetical protein
VRLIQCANRVYRHEVQLCKVSPASLLRRYVGPRLLFDLLSWHRRGSPPRFDDQEDDGSEDDEYIDTKGIGDRIYLLLHVYSMC